MYTTLVIDDDSQILHLCRVLLEREGYTVFAAATGDAGLEMCCNESIDLVITDIIMPDKDGLETISEIKTQFPEIRIVAMSGGGRLGPDSYLPLAKKLGAADVLCKPFTRNELLTVVEEQVRENTGGNKDKSITPTEETQN